VGRKGGDAATILSEPQGHEATGRTRHRRCIDIDLEVVLAELAFGCRGRLHLDVGFRSGLFDVLDQSGGAVGAVAVDLDRIISVNVNVRVNVRVNVNVNVSVRVGVSVGVSVSVHQHFGEDALGDRAISHVAGRYLGGDDDLRVGVDGDVALFLLGGES
jgi:hypothetical protein